MPSDIPANVAYIAGMWSGALLYGIHLVVYGVVCSILLSKAYKRGREISAGALLAFTTCLFILCTAHIAVVLQEVLLGFIYQHDSDSREFYEQNLFPQRKALYIIILILADSLLIWRAHVIWGRKWHISALPFLILSAGAACGLATIIISFTSPRFVFNPSILSWVTATLALNMATQLSSTILIAIKVYRAAAASSRSRSRYMSLVWLIVESGAIYTTAAIAQLVMCITKLNGGIMLEMMLAQLSAIAPGLILIRVGLGVAYDGTNETAREEVVLTTLHDTIPSTIGTMGQSSSTKSVADTLS